MKQRPLALATILLAGGLAAAGAGHAKVVPGDTFAVKTKGCERRSGLLTTWLDARGGRLLLELPRPAGPRGSCGTYLYLEGIETGLGSNAVGLDRGQAGEARVVEFRRVGARNP